MLLTRIDCCVEGQHSRAVCRCLRGTVADDDVTLQSANQMLNMPEYLVVCAWRSVKEVSLLLGQLTATAPVVDPSSKVDDPSSKVVDPGSKVVDPDIKGVDPSSKVVDPNIKVVTGSSYPAEMNDGLITVGLVSDSWAFFNRLTLL